MSSLETLEHRPAWMDEDSTSSPALLQRPPGNEAIRMVGFTIVLTLLPLLGALLYGLEAGRFATGPWHGLLVATLPFAPPPFISYWSVHALTALTGMASISVAHLLQLAALLLLFGAVAGLAASASSRAIGPAHTHGLLCAGVVLLLALHPSIRHALEDLNPGMLSAGLALFGLAILFQPHAGATVTMRAIVAGCAFGLAAANELAFLWVAIIALFAYVLFGNANRPIEGFLALVLGFAVTATWPLFHSLTQGQSLAFFLSHALETPAPGLRALQWDMGMFTDAAWPTVLFLLAAPLAVGHSIFHRDYAFLFASLGSLFVMGPLHKTFMVEQESAMLLPGSDGPVIFSLALVAVLGSRGAQALLVYLAETFRKWRLLSLAAALFFLLASISVVAHLTKPLHDSRPLALALATSLPEDAIVIYSDPTLMSYGVLQEAADADGTAKTLLYRNDFSHWWGRARLAQLEMDNLAWRSLPLSGDDLNRWRGELTFYLQDRLPEMPSASEKHFAGLRLWDFVAQNRHNAPLYFVGAQDSWIVAQATPTGPFLRTGPETGSLDPPDFDTARRELEALPVAPGIEALSLALSWAARLQGAPEEAIAFADLATQHGASIAGEAARIRSLARGGNTDAAMAAVDAYWKNGHSPQSADALQSGIQRAFRANRAERELHAALAREDGPMFSDDAESLLTPLWEGQELRPLAHIFYKASQQNPDDLNALYQLAAIQALMGAYREADETLQKWALRGQFRFGDIDKQLQQDFRFRPFRIHWQRKEEASDFDKLLANPSHNSLPFRRGLVYP